MKISWKDSLKLFLILFGLYIGIYYWPKTVSFLKSLLSASLPLILGGVIAYLLNILMSAYERSFFPRSKNPALLRSRRVICMIGAFVTLIAIVALVIGLILPQLISCVRLIIEKIPGFVSSVVAFLDRFDLIPDDIIHKLTLIDWNSRIEEILKVLTSGLGDVMSVVVSAVSSVFSGLVTTLLSIIFAIYLLLGKNDLKRQFHAVANHYLSDRLCGRMEYVMGVINDCFHRYIVGQCIEAVIIGVLCTLGMSILKLPYATMIGALVAFTALIPIAGAYIGALVGAFMIFTVNPMQALIFLIFLVILQQLEGNLIYPKVVGSSLGLPGIWVLAAVTVGGGIMGVLGMLLGVPLAAAAYRFIRDDVYPQSEDEEAKEETQ